MPLYEYQCQECAETHEIVQRFSDEPQTICPSCGGMLKKLISSPAIHFKGSGFYLTDYGKGTSGRAGGNGGSEAASSGSESSPAPSDSSKSDTAKPDSPKSDSAKTDAPKSSPASPSSPSSRDSGS